MTDMGQADRDLRSDRKTPPKMIWMVALKKAAAEMGFKHWFNIPDDRVEELTTIAKRIQQEAEDG